MGEPGPAPQGWRPSGWRTGGAVPRKQSESAENWDEPGEGRRPVPRMAPWQQCCGGVGEGQRALGVVQQVQRAGPAGSGGGYIQPGVSAQPDCRSRMRRKYRHLRVHHPRLFSRLPRMIRQSEGRFRGGALGRGQEVLPVCPVRPPSQSSAERGLSTGLAAHSSGGCESRVRASPWCACAVFSVSSVADG